MTPELRVSDVSVTFGPRPALEDVTFTVASGELVAVVGENGAGKTTLVGCVSGVMTPDRGEVTVCGRDPASALHAGDLAVVWQDLALCDNLSVTANLFLGSEVGRVFLARRKMRSEVAHVLGRVGLGLDLLNRRIGDLSGGERQAVAIARALMVGPRVLVLDEPTSALGLQETRRIEGLLRSLRDDGVAILLVSHRMEQVFGLADRVVALRHGRLVGDVSTVEAHADDIVALMSGLNIDSVARRHLARLSSLVDQLAGVEPSASLPMIVSAMSTAFGLQQMCVHLRDPQPGNELVLCASVGVSEATLRDLATVPVGPTGGCIGEAAATRLPIVAEDLRSRGWRVSGALSMWSVPIQGNGEVYGVLSGLADVPGRLQDDQLRLASVYASLAATAIEREGLVHDLTRRNRVLESLRGVLAALAGPEQLPSSLNPALYALAGGLRADATTLIEVDQSTGDARVHAVAAPDGGPSSDELVSTLVGAIGGGLWRQGVRRLAPQVIGLPFEVVGRRFVLGARWASGSGQTSDSEELLESAGRSLRLAVERELAQASQAEADALRRIGDLQRDFIQRLSHELRTPLTAITGYASTLRATDVNWDEPSRQRFLEAIAVESARMGRLVGDLLDSSAISSGVMTMHPDWCDLSTLLAAAVSVLPDGGRDIIVEVGRVPPVWADHDRLEQVVVNLLDNAARHGSPPTTLRAYQDGINAVIEVSDTGPGIPERLRDSVVQPYVRGDTTLAGAGLGLSICKSIVEAHGGSLDIVGVPYGALLRVTLPVDPGPAEAA